MGGVQRTTKFVKYLPKYDWKCYVLTTTPKTFYAKDDSLLAELDRNNVQILRTKIRSAKNLLNYAKVTPLPKEKFRKFLSKAAQIFLLPDSKILWKKKALKLAKEIIEKEKIDLIYSTAPPYTDFLVGLELKNKYNIPLVIDYRDSWIDCPYNFYLTPVHKSLNIKLEREVLKHCDNIITINRRIKELIVERYSNVKYNDVTILPQGYDEEDFIKANHNLPRTNRMRITYSGSFLNFMTPKYMLEAFKMIFEKFPELRREIELCLVGVLSKENMNMIAKSGLRDNVTTTGYIDHLVSIKYLIASDILWLMIGKNKGSEMISTGKLFEYFGARKPILATIPDGVAKNVLKNYGAYKVCEPDNPKEIAKLILEFYKLYKSKELPVPDEEFVQHYSRESLTQQLVRMFEFLINIETQFETKGIIYNE